jgi:hypothetical protein
MQDLWLPKLFITTLVIIIGSVPSALLLTKSFTMNCVMNDFVRESVLLICYEQDLPANCRPILLHHGRYIVIVILMSENVCIP